MEEEGELCAGAETLLNQWLHGGWDAGEHAGDGRGETSLGGGGVCKMQEMGVDVALVSGVFGGEGFSFRVKLKELPLGVEGVAREPG